MDFIRASRGCLCLRPILNSIKFLSSSCVCSKFRQCISRLASLGQSMTSARALYKSHCFWTIIRSQTQEKARPGRRLQPFRSQNVLPRCISVRAGMKQSSQYFSDASRPSMRSALRLWDENRSAYICHALRLLFPQRLSNEHVTQHSMHSQRIVGLRKSPTKESDVVTRQTHQQFLIRQIRTL